MSLFFVTGTAGAGKSSVTKELKARGYEAYDTDEDGFARWQNDQTGYIHPQSSVGSKERTEAFLKNHSWNVQRKEVESLAESATDKPIFLCGVAYNEDEIRDLFEAVFVLEVDDKTLLHRLSTRITNSWGKQPHEIQHTLERQHRLNELQPTLGRILVDATQPIDIVVDQILDRTI